MRSLRTPVAVICIALVAFAPWLGAGVEQLYAILVPLWSGSPAARVILVRREPLRAAEQLVALFSVRTCRAPPFRQATT